MQIGYCRDKGVGTESNLKMADEKSANKGNVIAKYNLGNCYRFGKGVDKDEKRAFELFGQLAEKDHLRGITMLGFCYRSV